MKILTQENLCIIDLDQDRYKQIGLESDRDFIRVHDSEATSGTAKWSKSAASFTDALYLAFMNHIPMKISPEDIHLMIIQGLCNIINLYPEVFRKDLVDHQGKKEVTVQLDEAMGLYQSGSIIKPSDKKVIDALVDKLNAISNPKLNELFLQRYSTSTALDDLNKHAVMLGTYLPYHNYVAETMCGIFQYTLLGTEEDWKILSTLPQKILVAFDLDAVSQEDAEVVDADKKLTLTALHNWAGHLQNILGIMHDSRKADVSEDRMKEIEKFWNSFFRFNQDSGYDYINGYVQCFFPCVRKVKAVDYCNVQVSDEIVLNSRMLASPIDSINQSRALPDQLFGQIAVPIKVVDTSGILSSKYVQLKVGFSSVCYESHRRRVADKNNEVVVNSEISCERQPRLA